LHCSYEIAEGSSNVKSLPDVNRRRQRPSDDHGAFQKSDFMTPLDAFDRSAKTSVRQQREAPTAGRLSSVSNSHDPSVLPPVVRMEASAPCPTITP
jgi:hypothetical protein